MRRNGWPTSQCTLSGWTDSDTKVQAVDLREKPSARWFYIIVWTMYDLRMTDHKATRCTNECLYIYTLARERPGPCPLRWAVSIVFKPHIWNHCTNAVLLKAQRTLEVKESERTTTLPRPSATSTPDRSVSLTCAMREFSDIEELTSGGPADGHSMDAQATVLLIV